MTPRRHLNRLVDGMRRDRAEERARVPDHVREQNMLDGLFALDDLCECGHELGYHGGAGFPFASCGYAGCECRLFRKHYEEKRPMTPLAEIDPLQDMPEPPEPPPPDPLEDMPEPPENGDTATENRPGEPPEDARPALKQMLDESGLLAHPVEIAGDLERRQLLQDLGFRRPPPDPLDALSQPVGAPQSDDRPEPTETPVLFPVLLQGQAGVPVDALAEPARRVAEIVEALEPVLLPPPAVAQLEDLLTRAAAVTVVTNAEQYQAACDLYELLQANEKGLELAVGPVKAFFYRPWKTICNFLGKYQPRIEAEKQRLSPMAGAWKKAETDRAEREAREKAEQEAAAEQQRLRDDAERARALATQTAIEQGPSAPEAAKLTHVAEILEHAATRVLPVAQSIQSHVPATNGTKGKTKWVGQIVDEDLFYKGLGDGTIPRTFVEVKQGTLDSQATDLKAELEKRYPGLRAVEVPGIGAKGRR